ncbi:hypothetical protein [Colwellia sp.]|nr:hypothetical protein [Colwellia sp.]
MMKKSAIIRIVAQQAITNTIFIKFMILLCVGKINQGKALD